MKAPSDEKTINKGIRVYKDINEEPDAASASVKKSKFDDMLSY